jgi:AraC-like DNA-binding protein
MVQKPVSTVAAAGRRHSLDKREPAVYSTNVLAALVDAMGMQGVEAGALLRGSHLDAAQLTRPSTRVSIQQMLAVFANAQALAPDVLAAARAGTRTTISSLGIYGYAVLSSPTHAQAVQVIQQYDRVVSPFTAMSFERQDDWAVWSVSTHDCLDASPALRRFVLEFKFAAMQTILRDLYGGHCGFSDIGLACPPASSHSAAALAALLGCEVAYHCAASRARFPASQMSRPMEFASHLTHAQMRELCDDAMQLVGEHGTLAERVMSQLLRSPGQFPSIQVMAGLLELNPRTLQRRLEAEGAHYRDLLARVKARLALKYLRSTTMTTAEVAERLGYCDAGSFRHAVLHWFGISPSQLRRGVTPPRQPG